MKASTHKGSQHWFNKIENLSHPSFQVSYGRHCVPVYYTHAQTTRSKNQTVVSTNPDKNAN